MSSEPDRLSVIELQRIVPLAEAARLSSLSPDSLMRHYRDKLIQLSPRRFGMRVGDALQLTVSKKKSA